IQTTRLAIKPQNIQLVEEKIMFIYNQSIYKQKEYSAFELLFKANSIDTYSKDTIQDINRPSYLLSNNSGLKNSLLVFSINIFIDRSTNSFLDIYSPILIINQPTQNEATSKEVFREDY
ncbi:36895_t:CDS:2, partial [Racocetra persica]